MLSRFSLSSCQPFISPKAIWFPNPVLMQPKYSLNLLLSLLYVHLWSWGELGGGLFCSRQGFAQVQYSLELTMYPRLASALQQSCLSLQSSGIIGMSRHTDLESKASREFLSVPSPLQWHCFHRSVSETHIKANTMFCSKAFGDTFCGLVLHYRRMFSQQYRFSSCPSRIIFLHLALRWPLNS